VSLVDHIPDGALLTIDSAPIIYALEGNPRFAPTYVELFEAVATGRFRAVASAVTLAEVLTGPLKRGDEVLAARYNEALCRAPGWRVVDVSADLARQAAQVRARTGLKLPDAIQVATALMTGSHALISQDRDFRAVKGLPILSAS
jgi:predicted nucleic acid-binding protein